MFMRARKPFPANGGIVMAERIRLPGLDWFLGDKQKNKHNTYTGSYGTDPLTGCMNHATFHYKVAIQEDESGDKQLVASYYIRPPWNQQTAEPQVQQQAFELSHQGLQAAEAFLEQAIFTFETCQKH